MRVEEARGSETTATKLVAALCGAQRPESILTWLRRAAVRDLLARLATGEIPLSHEALDQEPNSLRVQRWLTTKLANVADADIRRPVESFSRWHHLRRIRSLSAEGNPTRGPVHSAKQEITETIKFLIWLKLTHGRTVASCVQADVDAWLADGPTTRHAIRTFFVWAVKNRTCTNITIGFRQAKTVPLLTQGQRLAMLKACLIDDIDTLQYRVAATLLLLYAQPVVKIASMKSTDVILTPDGLRLSLGEGTLHQYRSRSRHCSENTWPHAPTCAPAAVQAASGCSPATGPDITSTQTRSWSVSGKSASISSVHATRPSARSSPKCPRLSSPKCSATAIK